MGPKIDHTEDIFPAFYEMTYVTHHSLACSHVNILTWWFERHCAFSVFPIGVS